jgi:nicotinate-nucleotide--dimethylbenzimidazole phosphoribosyltransferase
MLDWVHDPVKPIATAAYQHALDRQLRLTKPPGSLGQLEEIAARLCGMQNSDKPRMARVQISIFAADHGVAEEGVSAFPQVVTTEMVRNFAAGGAAISVLAKHLGAELEVVDVGVRYDTSTIKGVIRARVAEGTANFMYGPAMTQEQLAAALQAGRDAVARAQDCGAQLFIAGDMGIANTTSATAITCALLGKSAREIVGPGTGLDRAGISHKAAVIQCSLDLHSADIKSPLDVLQRLGGFEIAAMTGAYIAAAQQGLPVLIDGFISSAAALLASYINNAASTWWFYGHTSAEPGHVYILHELNARPLLNLGMRLGEGSGAAMAIPLLRQACILHTKMATFDQAGVSTS